MKWIILLFSINLFGSSFCDEGVRKFEKEHGSISVSIIDKVGKTPFLLNKNTYNLCTSFESFISEKENIDLYKKFLKEKYGETSTDAKTFLELLLKEEKPEMFLDYLIREKNKEAKDFLIKKTYLY